MSLRRLAMAAGRFFQLPYAMGLDGMPTEAKMLWSFDRATVGQWLVATDRSIGGKSRCTFAHISDASIDAAGEAGTEEPEEGVGEGLGEGGTAEEVAVGSAGTAHGVFSGTISLARTGKVKHSGYCAIVSERLAEPIDLEGFEALEMRVRTDGRIYMVNMTMDTMMDDLYQGYIMLEGGEWHTLELPFDRFLLTSRGRARDVQRKMDVDQMLSFGITLADQQEGPFSLEIEYIKALPRTTPYLDLH